MAVNKNLIPAIMLTFVNVLGFSILFPILPFIIEQYNLPQIWYGILLSSYAMALFFGAPLLGSLSDHFGRKPMLIISHLGTLSSWFVFILAYFVPATRTLFSIPIAIILILISRIFDGITGGNNSIVSALITDHTKPEERSKVFSYMGATFGIGFMVGPLLGSLSYQTRYTYLGTCILAILISTITLIAIIKFVKESNKTEKKDNWLQLTLEKLNIAKSFLKYKNKPIITSTFAIKLFVVLGFSGFTSINALYLIDKFNLDSTGVGVFLFIIGIYSIVNQGLFVPKVVSKISEGKTLLIGCILLSLGLFIIYFAQNIYIFAILAYIFSAGIALIAPTIKTILSNNSSQKEQGEVLGLQESMQSLSHAIMPFIATLIYLSFSSFSFIYFSIFIAVTTIPLTIKIIKTIRQ